MSQLHWESQPDVMTIEEVSRFLRRGKAFVYELCHRKDFPALKLGRTWRISKNGLQQWWEEQTKAR